MLKTNELTWATVDLEDPEQAALFRARELAQARERVSHAIATNQDRGLVDAEGRRIRKDLPPEMSTSRNDS